MADSAKQKFKTTLLHLTTRWLENFSDRNELRASVFLLAGLAAVLIALATVTWQSINLGGDRKPRRMFEK